MCRSLPEGGRRCPCTGYSKSLANQNRSKARATRRLVVSRAREFGGARFAEAVAVLPPSRLLPLTMAADALYPGASNTLTRGLSGNLPGIHNMVTEDRRDRNSNFGKANNSAKLDQHAIADVQNAMLEFDKAVLAKGVLPEDESARLSSSIGVREKAIELGLLDGRTVGVNRVPDMTPDQKRFYLELRPEDAHGLVDVQQRVSQTFWERHLNEARFDTEERHPLDESILRGQHGVPKTLGELMAAHPGKAFRMCDDLVVRSNEAGEIFIDDHANGTTVSAPANMRALDAISRLPRITDIRLPDSESSLSQRLVEHKFLDPTSREGLSHRKTLKAAAAQELFHSRIPVNRGEEGKALRQNHFHLAKAGLARATAQTSMARIEGFELDGHLRAAELIKNTQLTKTAEAMNAPLTTEKKTRNGTDRSIPSKSYSGPLRGSLPTIKWGGFHPRSEKGATPESAIVNTLSPRIFNAGPPKDMFKASDRSLGADLAALTYEANRLVRKGHHPETVGERAHLAAARLDDAFRMNRSQSPHSPTVINSREQVPGSWSDDDGDFLDKVFTPGSRLDTTGYTVGAVNKSAADAGAQGEKRPRQYKVQYLSTSHITEADGTAVIGAKTGFRVHSVDRTGELPVVRLVQDDLAADVAAGGVTL